MIIQLGHAGFSTIFSVMFLDNGWTSNFIGTEWFKRLFIPQAKAMNMSGKPILLIYDGHSSHESIELQDTAHAAGIHLYLLPPHTSHHLQPLYVSVFGPSQCAWLWQCLQVMEETGEGIKCQNVIKEYMITCTKSFKESTILSAWKKSGMQPLNPHIFAEKVFGASFRSSTHPPMPDSFPVWPYSNDNPVPVDGIDGGINDGDNNEGDSMMVGEGR